MNTLTDRNCFSIGDAVTNGWIKGRIIDVRTKSKHGLKRIQYKVVIGNIDTVKHYCAPKRYEYWFYESDIWNIPKPERVIKKGFWQGVKAAMQELFKTS